MRNPFTLSFGKIPSNYIQRSVQEDEIIQDFLDESPSSQIYLLTGVRGTGKTVALTHIAKEISAEPDWTVVNLRTGTSLIDQLADHLINKPSLVSILKQAGLNLSVFGVQFQFSASLPVTSKEEALDQILYQMTKHGKSLLVTVDEVIPSVEMRDFASLFQIFIRQDYRIFLLMSGLYENISDLQNTENLTFLHRAPKIRLEPLNLSRIAHQYRETFQSVLDLTEQEAAQMASLTKGFSYAFQVLGYHCWKEKKKWPDILDQYDLTLEEYVYDKIWSELSEKDRRVLWAMASSADSSVKAIRQAAEMNSSMFSVYRDRLIKRQLVDSSQYGKLFFTLPRFDAFVRRKIEYEQE